MVCAPHLSVLPTPAHRVVQQMMARPLSCLQRLGRSTSSGGGTMTASSGMDLSSYPYPIARARLRGA
eukprot:7069040-Alexandrium_andersonii.AAC.1